jgi:hypothetical protein
MIELEEIIQDHDHELAEYGKELAEQTSLWRRTKLDAKKFAKAAKEITDKCEDKMIELEEIIQDHARLSPVDVQWEYDFTGGVKKLRRCDTWEIAKEETLTVEERQPSFDFDASVKAVEKLKEVQSDSKEGTHDEATSPEKETEGAEADSAPVEDDDSGCFAGEVNQSSFPSTPEVHIEEVVAPGTDESLPVINIDEKPEIDSERRCCFPSDREELVEGDVVISYCRVCHLVLKKVPVGGDPWETIDFVYGEKVNLEEPGAQA